MTNDIFAEQVKFIEELKRQWLATIDAMVDPMMFIKNDFTIAKCNKATAQISGMDIKDTIGQKCHVVFAGTTTPCQGCQLTQQIAQQKNCHFPLNKIRDQYYYEVSSQPFYTPEGMIEGFIHVYRDRTIAKRLENQLLQKEKLASIGLLAGGIAHEINNPLGGILIFSQMLLREMEQKSPHYSDVVEIESAAKRCKSIVDRLLDFARQQPQYENRESLEEISLKTMMLDALKFAKIAKESKKIKVMEHWSSKDFKIKANKTKATQLFLNLIQNAFQAMPNGGTLTLTTKFDQQFAYYTITDTGIGIDDAHKDKIFDPFFTTKDPGQGTGLGLSIVHTLAQEMDGVISVESKKNHGTSVTLKILLHHLNEIYSSPDK